MRIQRRVTFRNRRHQRLVGIIDRPEGTGRHPGVVISHGFTGHKDERHLRQLAVRLVRSGFVVLRFDFSHAGESEGQYEDQTITRQLPDVGAALAYMRRQRFVHPARVGLVGHSQGGLLSLLHASRDPDVHAVVSISSPGRVRSYPPAPIAPWRRKGYADFPSHRYGRIRVKYAFVRDAQRYDARVPIGKIAAPVLLVHGTRDPLVPPSVAQTLYRYAIEPKELSLIARGSHTFKDDRRARQEMIRVVTRFLHVTIGRDVVPVVNAFVEHDGKYLMLRRSSRVGSYRGTWHVVAGHLEPRERPLDRARQELAEETGLRASQVRLVRRGKPFTTQDARTGHRWAIQPFLFHATTGRIRCNWEHTAYRWLTREQLGHVPTVFGFRRNLVSLGL